VIIVNGTIGDHGAAVIRARENLSLSSDMLSDSAPLNGLIAEILKVSPNVHCMRDATRGGLGAILAEIAKSAQVFINVDEKAFPFRITYWPSAKSWVLIRSFWPMKAK